MAWIQGQRGVWYRNPKWWTDDFMLDTEEVDGDMTGLCYGRGRFLKLRLGEIGFIEPKIKPASGVSTVNDRQNAFHVVPSQPVPTPTQHTGNIETYLHEAEFNEEVVVRYAILITEGQARELWGPSPSPALIGWFGDKGKAKRLLRKAFTLNDDNPFHYPAMTQGGILVTQKGRRV